jgi:hypothetical protein
MNMFADMRNPRYIGVLLEAQKLIAKPELKQRVEKVVAKLGTPSSQYVPGTIDIAAKRAEFESIIREYRKADRSGFKEIHIEDPLTAVLDRLGSPDLVSGITSYGKWGRAETFVAHYQDVGLIAHRFDSKAHRWVVFEKAEELLPVKTIYSGSYPGLAQMIASFRGVSFRNLMKYYNQPMREEEALMELLAQRAMLNSYLPDSLEDDGLEIAVKFVNLLKTPKAEALLQQIARQSSSKDARKAAELFLKRRQVLAQRAKGSD